MVCGTVQCRLIPSFLLVFVMFRSRTTCSPSFTTCARRREPGPRSSFIQVWGRIEDVGLLLAPQQHHSNTTATPQQHHSNTSTHESLVLQKPFHSSIFYCALMSHTPSSRSGYRPPTGSLAEAESSEGGAALISALTQALAETASAVVSDPSGMGRMELQRPWFSSATSRSIGGSSDMYA